MILRIILAICFILLGYYGVKKNLEQKTLKNYIQGFIVALSSSIFVFIILEEILK